MDWTDDVALDPTFLSGMDLTARWVLMYQVENTGPDPEAPLQNFNVTSTRKNGTPVEENPYTSGGYFADSRV